MARPTGLTQIDLSRSSGLRPVIVNDDVQNAIAFCRTKVSSSRRNHKYNKEPHQGALCCIGAPDKIRTCDPQIRNLVLYPTELRALAYFSISYSFCSGETPKHATSATSGRAKTMVIGLPSTSSIIAELSTATVLILSRQSFIGCRH